MPEPGTVPDRPGATGAPGAPVGLVLAAGAGRRYGSPKILVPGWLEAAVAALRDGGCGRVVVVTGAARPALPAGCDEAWCERWADGPGASLATGLAAALGDDTGDQGDTADAHPGIVIRLVDTPDIGADCVARVLTAAGLGPGGAPGAPGGASGAHPVAPGSPAPARATFGGVPGHPVALPARVARELLAHLRAPGADPARGAGPFLAARADVRAVECADLATGADVDAPVANTDTSDTPDTPGNAAEHAAPDRASGPDHPVTRPAVPVLGLAAEVRLGR